MEQNAQCAHQFNNAKVVCDQKHVLKVFCLNSVHDAFELVKRAGHLNVPKHLKDVQMGISLHHNKVGQAASRIENECASHVSVRNF